MAKAYVMYGGLLVPVGGSSGGGGGGGTPVGDLSVPYGYGERAIDPDATYTSIEVQNLNDGGVGSFKEAFGLAGNHKITFKAGMSGNIRHLSEAVGYGRKWINGDGRITFGGHRLNVAAGRMTHLVVQNVELGSATNPVDLEGADAIIVYGGSQDLHCWFDGITALGRYHVDGLIDIVLGNSTQMVSASFSRIHLDHTYKTFLVGTNASDTGAVNFRVSFYRCYFNGAQYRLPFVRRGRVHFFNNYVNNWGDIDPNLSGENEILHLCTEAQGLLENNVLQAGTYTRVINYANGSEGTGYSRALNNLLENGATISEVSPNLVANPGDETYTDNGVTRSYYSLRDYTSILLPADQNLKTTVTSGAGWQGVI